MTLRALMIAAAAQLIASCDSPESRAIEIDFSVGDQCAWMPAERPGDCASQPPCIYSDADLHIQRAASGSYHLTANATGWREGYRASNRTITVNAPSTDALATQFPNLLQALGGETQVVSDACVYLDPSQDMSVGEVIAFHDAIAAHDVRKIAFYNVLADDWR